MRVRIFIICCLFSCSLLSACGQKGENSETVTRVTSAPITEKPAETKIETETETETELQTQEKGRELTIREMEFFERYVNQAGNYGFLLSDYDSAAGASLEEVFYSGAGLDMPEMSVQEQEAYLKAVEGDEIYTDVTHLRTEQIEKFLLEKTGLSYEEMEKPLSWVYVPEYDTYYHEAGDTNAVQWECVAGRVMDGQTYVLQFRSREAYVPDCELVLKKTGEGYHFISNKQL